MTPITGTVKPTWLSAGAVLAALDAPQIKSQAAEHVPVFQLLFWGDPARSVDVCPVFDRGVDVCHETVRFWWDKFGLLFASESGPVNEPAPRDCV